MTLALLLLSTAACFPRLEFSDSDGGESDVGNDNGSGGDDADGGSGGGSSGSDSGTAPPSLSSAEPANGSNAGGRRVTLQGDNLGEPSEVWFADARASIVSTGRDAVVVEAPAAPGVVGPVAVRIETDGGESTLSDAFHYWEDATGEAVTVLRARAVRGWDERGTWDDFQAIGWNTLPVDRWSTDNQAGMSSCTASYGDPALQPAPDELVLSGELGTLTLEQDAGSEALYYDADEPSLEELAGTRHDVSVPAGGTWPAYTVSDGIAFPDDITLFSPSPYGYDSYDQDDFAIEWEAWGADRILIGFLDASSDAVAICAVPDTGDYTVPPDAYGGFVPSESGWWGEAWVMQVVVLAYRDTSSVLDFNNGELRAQGGIGYATWVRVEDSWF